MSPTIQIERITPKFARDTLAAHNDANRPIRQWWVDELARAITEGRWRFSHVGIAFNCDGSLIDGQHRLAAIAKAGKTVPMFVTRGLARDAVYAIDQGITRTVIDITSSIGTGANLNSSQVAVARAMIRGMSRNGFVSSKCRLSNEELLAFVTRHLDAINLAVGAIPKKTGLRFAPMLAAVARASYHESHPDLISFCGSYVSGIANGPGDVAAVLLRDYVIRQRGNGEIGRYEMYCKSEAAIRAFMKRQRITRLYGVEKELYQLPEVE